MSYCTHLNNTNTDIKVYTRNISCIKQKIVYLDKYKKSKTKGNLRFQIN